jgi:hypothetical protein
MTPDGQLLVPSYDFKLYSLDPVSKSEKWVFSGSDNRLIGSPFVFENLIYQPSADGNVYVVDLQGNQVRVLETEEAAAPVADPAAVPAPTPAPAAAAPAPAPAVGQVPSPVAEATEEVEEGVSSEEMAEALVAINEENESLKKQTSRSSKHC